MQRIQEIFLNKLQMSSLEDKITTDNTEAFVNLYFTCLSFVLVFSDFQFILYLRARRLEAKPNRAKLKLSYYLQFYFVLSI